MTDADNTDAAVTRTLLALRALTVPDPFRSQSPAAPPAATGWEIAEVVSILLHAYGYGDLPESVASRALLAGELGQPFRDVLGAENTELRVAGCDFISRTIEWTSRNTATG